MTKNSLHCIECNSLITNYGKKFCSHSCSAKHSNRNRLTRSDESKNKTSLSLRIYHKSIPKEPKPIKPQKISNIRAMVKYETENAESEFTLIRLCSCKVCKNTFYSTSQLQYCSTCRSHHSNLKSRYWFKFNVFNYPQLFNLELLNEVGFYAPKGKSGRWNPNGLSRDHKISVTEAIKNNYDPYYITHPMNCELMPHIQNNKKKTKSSITYDELVILVDEFDSA